MISEPFSEAGVTARWAHEFVLNSNLIDPQPGLNAPGSPVYDLHMSALRYVIEAGLHDCYVLPRQLHKSLLGAHPLAGVQRTEPITIAFRETLSPKRVGYYVWRWNADAKERIDALRMYRKNASSLERQEVVWGLHCELMNIRPFELYNGRVGRLLMVNHAILVGERPWIVYASQRPLYMRVIHTHPSATWVHQPLYRPSALRYREWEAAKFPR